MIYFLVSENGIIRKSSNRRFSKKWWRDMYHYFNEEYMWAKRYKQEHFATLASRKAEYCIGKL